MDIKFSARFIKITFENGEPFSGKSVRMRGEPLVNGYDAALSTAEWLKNHIGYPVENSELSLIKKAIEINNAKDSFQIVFMGE